MHTTESEPQLEAPASEEREVLALTIVHHPHADVCGAREPMPAGRRLVVGRAEECAFPGAFDGPRVSRRHAELASDGARIELRDLDSRNGTFVNGGRVAAASLAPGDVLRVGHVVLLVGRAPQSWSDAPSPVLVGASFALAQVKRQIVAAAASPIVTLVGETGVGKELVARSVHERSGRTGAFAAVNCAAIADGVLHSELFGHASGAFSGAQSAHDGLVAQAARGTLFLDEISAASAAFQASLLRLMETGDYRPVGASSPRQADVRFVAALQPGVGALIDEGRFRRDLWSRLARWLINVPPLRQRLEDVPLLARHFARQAAGREVAISPELAVALLRYPWPGNVRELRAFIERSVAMEQPEGELRLHRWQAAELEATARPNVATSAPRRSPTACPERDELASLLGDCGGNVTDAARRLGVPRKTLYRWLERLGLERG
jgi:transcriptional regulator with PAS, ATPase and Fis domain